MLEDRPYMRERQATARRTSLRRLSVVTWLLLVTGTVFFLQLLTAGRPGGNLEPWLWLGPGELQRYQVWRLVSHLFVHVDFSHVFFNMLGLWFFGPQVEQVLGRPRFLLLYLVGGLAGAACWLPFSNYYSVLLGASGAVLAVTAAAAFFYPNQTVLFLFVIPMRLRTFALSFAAMSVLFYYWGLPSQLQPVGGVLPWWARVAHLAHLGGLVAGYSFVWGWSLVTARRAPARSPGWWARCRRWFSRGRGPVSPADLHIIEDDVQLGADPLTQIDPILDKIGKLGMKSLTPRERELLERAGRQWKGDG